MRISAITLLSVAALLLGSGTAQAVMVSGYTTAHQQFCTTVGNKVDLAYINKYGNLERARNVVLTGSKRNGIACSTKSIRHHGGSEYYASEISSRHGGFVYCAIYSGRKKLSESRDNGRSYSWAVCN